MIRSMVHVERDLSRPLSSAWLPPVEWVAGLEPERMAFVPLRGPDAGEHLPVVAIVGFRGDEPIESGLIVETHRGAWALRAVKFDGYLVDSARLIDREAAREVGRQARELLAASEAPAGGAA